MHENRWRTLNVWGGSRRICVRRKWNTGKGSGWTWKGDTLYLAHVVCLKGTGSNACYDLLVRGVACTHEMGSISVEVC